MIRTLSNRKHISSRLKYNLNDPRNYEAALSDLDALVRKYPDSEVALFSAAKLRAALGDLNSACNELVELINRNYPVYGPAFESNFAFQTLRSTKAGMRLHNHVLAVETLWRKAEQDGIPALLLLMSSRRKKHDSRVRELREGVYLRESRRFLPAEPHAGQVSRANPDRSGGLSVRRGELIGARARGIRLSPLHEQMAVRHQVFYERASETALVITVGPQCQRATSEHQAGVPYVISVVSARTGQATVVAHGYGGAVVAFDGGGAVFLQTGETLRHWPSVAAMRREPGKLDMQGVLLSAPGTTPEGYCEPAMQPTGLRPL